MSNRSALPSVFRGILYVVLLAALAAGAWLYFNDRETWPRGQALGDALGPIMTGEDKDRALVAKAIWENYQETRANASRWSGVYWGFTFTAAVLSALAALVLKFETIVRNEGVKKDLAATLSIVAALLVTVSTSGDFQRKWQANRMAAAELERTGYEFLARNDAQPRTYLAKVGDSLMRRHMAIVGGSEQKEAEAGKPETKDGKPDATATKGR